MHNHDHDLIAALAEGLLADDLASAAEADLVGCAACSAELAEQRLALDALTSAPPAAMTTAEASMLRDTVAGALRIGDVPVPAAPARTRRSPWVAVAIAAGLAGVITIVPVIGLITPAGDDAGTSNTVAAAFEEAADEGSDQRDAIGGEDDAQDMEMALTAPAEAAPATTIAAATTAAPTTTSSDASLGMAEATETNSLADGQAAIGYLYEEGPKTGYTSATEQFERSSLACNAAAEQVFGNDFLYVDVSANLDDGSPVVLYAAADWSSLTAFDLDDCSIVLNLP